MKPIEEKYLGKSTPIPQKYTPEVLLAVPRQLNREKYGIQNDALPFSGVDVWHGYEAGFLTRKGLPVTGVLKLIYPAESEFLVESKSLKLYLNSFNMEPFGDSPARGIHNFMEIISRDLQKTLSTTVEVQFFNNHAARGPFDFSDYILLEELPETHEIDFKQYSEDPGLLDCTNNPEGTIKWASHLLRSNCKITHQPDWGSIFIYLKGYQRPTPRSLLQYLVSMRNEDHFHEEICELVYKRLYDRFEPGQLMVSCLYTRRGGLDICPIRTSHSDLLPPALSNINVLSQLTLRQ